MTKPLTLTKADLIQEVERITELKRSDSETIVETIFDSIIESLQKGDKIEIRGFGSFRTRHRRGRVGRNPKTGAKVEVPPKRFLSLSPAKSSRISSTARKPLHRREPRPLPATQNIPKPV